MILYRIFPWSASARPRDPGGALWWPRFFQGSGRHDNPLDYGCLYASEDEVSAVAEALAHFRGQKLAPGMLRSHERPLAIALLRLSDDAELVDLDRPRTLAAETLRPSLVATHDRDITQAYAARLYERHPQAVGLRWWSTLESQWANVTLFHRARPRLVGRPRRLSLEDGTVREAADFLGLLVA